MKPGLFLLLPLLVVLSGCAAGLSALGVDGIQLGDVCGTAGLSTCRTRSGNLDGSDLLVPAPGIIVRTSFADGYLMRALESGTARVGMASSQINVLVRVYKVNLDESLELLDEAENFDIGLGGSRATTQFPIEAGQEYLVVATSLGRDFGRYRLIYSESLNLFEDDLSVVGPLVEQSGRKTAVHLGASAAKSPPHGENQVDGIQEGSKRELDPRTE
jgi:hypothetical protein